MSFARTLRFVLLTTGCVVLASLARADVVPPPPPVATTPPPAATPAAPPAQSPPVPLAEAVKGLKGKGPLLAKIDIEQAGSDIKGSFTCTLYEDKTPITVANFVALARGLRKWQDPRTKNWVKKPLYDGTLIHRVLPGFMIQGGDPKGNGTGSPGYLFDDETKSDLVFDKGGLMAMANRGINRQTGQGTNGSQFFITEKETPWINGRNTIFGACDPVELVKKITGCETDPKNKERPARDIVIKKITISRGTRK